MSLSLVYSWRPKLAGQTHRFRLNRSASRLNICFPLYDHLVEELLHNSEMLGRAGRATLETSVTAECGTPSSSS